MTLNLKSFTDPLFVFALLEVAVAAEVATAIAALVDLNKDQPQLEI